MNECTMHCLCTSHALAIITDNFLHWPPPLPPLPIFTSHQLYTATQKYFNYARTDVEHVCVNVCLIRLFLWNKITTFNRTVNNGAMKPRHSMQFPFQDRAMHA